MQKLSLEKEETIQGITVWKVFYGIECLVRIEETGANAAMGSDGRSCAEQLADSKYEEYADRQRKGYPKTELIKSQMA